MRFNNFCTCFAALASSSSERCSSSSSVTVASLSDVSEFWTRSASASKLTPVRLFVSVTDDGFPSGTDMSPKVGVCRGSFDPCNASSSSSATLPSLVSSACRHLSESCCRWWSSRIFSRSCSSVSFRNCLVYVSAYVPCSHLGFDRTRGPALVQAAEHVTAAQGCSSSSPASFCAVRLVALSSATTICSSRSHSFSHLLMSSSSSPQARICQ
jgi:hypothetical protein